ncbi:hypothetical protein MRX96_031499 [Rhipicephalus microplus]
MTQHRQGPWVYKGPSPGSSATPTPGTVSPWEPNKTPLDKNLEQTWQSEMNALVAAEVPVVRRIEQPEPRGINVKVWFAMTCCLLTTGIVLAGLVIFVLSDDQYLKLQDYHELLTQNRRPWRLVHRSTAYTTPYCSYRANYFSIDPKRVLCAAPIKGQPLLCSVSETATVASMYPGDNLCDIIMYTHVRVDQGTIAPVDDADSYTTFTRVCSTVYSTTSCGISFDARFADPSYFTTKVSEQLTQLRQKNVVHLGILNMYDYPSRVKHYAPLTESALKKLAALKGPASRIIYGIGFFYYNDNSSWQNLQVLVLAATAAWEPLIYNMTEEYRLPTDALYKTCTGFIVSDSSQICEREETLLTGEYAIGGMASMQYRKLFYTYDTVQTMKEKAGFVMNSRRRRANLTWFLFNVHLTDLSKKCHPTGPFERLKEFRKFFLNISRRGY